MVLNSRWGSFDFTLGARRLIVCAGLLTLPAIGPATGTAQEMPKQLQEILAAQVGNTVRDAKFEERLLGPRNAVDNEMLRRSLAKAYGVEHIGGSVEDFFRNNAQEKSASMVPRRIAGRYAFEDGQPIERPAGAAPLGTVAAMSPEDLESQIAALKEFAKQSTARFNTPRSIPECTAQKTLEDQAPAGAQDSDTLVIRENKSFDPREFLGPGSRLIDYREGNANDKDSILVSFAEPECLPYRVRIVGGIRYRYFGDAALRRFDQRSSDKSKGRRRSVGSK